MATNNRISHRGTLQASIEMGIILTAVMSELVDNALDAHATEIMIYIPHVPDDVQTILEVYDNGNGMDREALNKAVSINMRTPATNETQGCKGAGMTNALAILTQLKSPAVIVSKRSDSSIVDIDIDYPDYIKYDNYNPTSGRNPSRPSEDLWNKRIRDELKSEHGTVMSIPSDDSKVSELLDAISSGEIHTNILYDFGIKYYKYMVNNPAIRIGFQVGTSATRFVQPIDPLFMSGLDAKYKRTDDCKLYVHKTSKKPQTRTYFRIDGNMGYTKNTKTKAEHTIEDLPAENSDWEYVSDFPIESAYSKDLMKEVGDIVQSIIENGQNSEQKHEQLTAKQIAQKDTNAQQKIDYGNGLYMNRSLKTITNVKLKQIKCGDFAKQKIYNNSRHRLTYPQIEMDKHMDTQLNKSALQYENVDMSIRNAVSVIREDFTKKQIALDAHVPASKPRVVVVPRPNPPVLPAAAPTAPAPGAAAPRVQTPNIVATLSASSNDPPAATGSSSGIANLVIQSPPSDITVPAQSHVRQHQRTLTPKKPAIDMINKLNRTAGVNRGAYANMLINVLCITNAKGGDVQLARQFMGLSKGNTELLSEQVIDTYNSKYSDNEPVLGGNDIAAFYREYFPENTMQNELGANV